MKLKNYIKFGIATVLITSGCLLLNAKPTGAFVFCGLQGSVAGSASCPLFLNFTYQPHPMGATYCSQSAGTQCTSRGFLVSQQ